MLLNKISGSFSAQFVRAKFTVHLIIGLLIFVCNICQLSAEMPSPNKYVVGGVSLNIPAPAGFMRADLMSNELNDWMISFTPPNNKSLALFVSLDDIDRIKKGDSPEMVRAAQIMIVRVMETKDVSDDLFSTMREVFRSKAETDFESNKMEINKLLLRASTSYSKKKDIDYEREVKKMSPLGIFLEIPNAIGLATINESSEKINGTNINTPRVQSTVAFRVKSRLLHCYIWSELRDNSDVAWVKEMSRMWVADILKKNSH